MVRLGVSFLEYYLSFFGDRKFMFVDLLPEENTDSHMALDDKFMALDSQKAPEDMDRYTHPCWCHPELIYADDLRGNEVWLHKRVQ